MATIKAYTDIEQSKKLAEILPIDIADMWYSIYGNPKYNPTIAYKGEQWFLCQIRISRHIDIPCWSLAALLKLIPKHILRKDKIHYGQAFIPSFRWEITPTAIYYTDGNDIMDHVSFRYGENNIELIDAVFKMICWLKENNLL